MLVDTSVWVDHFRSHDYALAQALENGDVLMHPFVAGELACGNLRNRAEIMALFNDLPGCAEATHSEVMALVEQRKLMGRGIGYVDACLLAAVLLSPWTQLWTRDKRLQRVATDLGVMAQSTPAHGI